MGVEQADLYINHLCKALFLKVVTLRSAFGTKLLLVSMEKAVSMRFCPKGSQIKYRNPKTPSYEAN